MNPTYTMSAHFYKSLYASWCQYRNPAAELPSPSSPPATSPSPTSARFFGSPSSSRSASPEKSSLELERPGSGKSST